eukprot:m.147735 g.147735  ORF g.147735 m.147735 type:complete len:745 (+) comp15044_c0_seq6:4322-6556(+)
MSLQSKLPSSPPTPRSSRPVVSPGSMHKATPRRPSTGARPLIISLAGLLFLDCACVRGLCFDSLCVILLLSSPFSFSFSIFINRSLVRQSQGNSHTVNQMDAQTSSHALILEALEALLVQANLLHGVCMQNLSYEVDSLALVGQSLPAISPTTSCFAVFSKQKSFFLDLESVRYERQANSYLWRKISPLFSNHEGAFLVFGGDDGALDALSVVSEHEDGKPAPTKIIEQLRRQVAPANLEYTLCFAFLVEGTEPDEALLLALQKRVQTSAAFEPSAFRSRDRDSTQSLLDCCFSFNQLQSRLERRTSLNTLPGRSVVSAAALNELPDIWLEGRAVKARVHASLAIDTSIVLGEAPCHLEIVCCGPSNSAVGSQQFLKSVIAKLRWDDYCLQPGQLFMGNSPCSARLVLGGTATPDLTPSATPCGGVVRLAFDLIKADCAYSASTALLQALLLADECPDPGLFSRTFLVLSETASALLTTLCARTLPPKRAQQAIAAVQDTLRIVLQQPSKGDINEGFRTRVEAVLGLLPAESASRLTIAQLESHAQAAMRKGLIDALARRSGSQATTDSEWGKQTSEERAIPAHVRADQSQHSCYPGQPSRINPASRSPRKRQRPSADALVTQCLGHEPSPAQIEFGAESQSQQGMGMVQAMVRAPEPDLQIAAQPSFAFQSLHTPFAAKAATATPPPMRTAHVIESHSHSALGLESQGDSVSHLEPQRVESGGEGECEGPIEDFDLLDGDWDA